MTAASLLTEAGRRVGDECVDEVVLERERNAFLKRSPKVERLCIKSTACARGEKGSYMTGVGSKSDNVWIANI